MQRAREDLQARIKSIRSLVNSSAKSVNEISSPAAVERRLAGHSPTQRSLSPQSPSERHTSIPPQSVEWPPTPGNMSHVDDRSVRPTVNCINRARTCQSHFSDILSFLRQTHQPSIRVHENKTIYSCRRVHDQTGYAGEWPTPDSNSNS